MSIYFPPVGMASEEYAAVGLPVIYRHFYEVILPFFQLSFKVVMIDDRQLYLFFFDECCLWPCCGPFQPSFSSVAIR